MFATALAVLASQTPALPMEQAGVSVSIARMAAESAAVRIVPDHAPSPAPGRLSGDVARSGLLVAFTNRAPKPAMLLREGNSWGYEMLRFEANDPAGRLYTIGRVPRPWDENAPSPFYVPNGDTVLRSVDFADGTWHGFPAGVSGSAEGWRVRVVLKVLPERILTDRGYWTGEVASRWYSANPM